MAAVTSIIMSNVHQFRNMMVYLLNKLHPNHRVHHVHKPKCYGNVTETDIVERAVKSVREFNAKPGKRGRKLETLGTLILARFAAGSSMDATENTFYDEGMARGMVDDGVLVSIQHENWCLDASDFNYMLSGWLEYPLRARRSSDADLLKKARDLSNQLVREMNVKRLSMGRPPIVLAADLAKTNARKKRGEKILSQLKEVAKTKSVTFQNLVPILKELGHRVPKMNPQADRIAIVPKGRKKAIRLSIFWLVSNCAQRNQLQNKPLELASVDSPTPINKLPEVEGSSADILDKQLSLSPPQRPSGPVR